MSTKTLFMKKKDKSIQIYYNISGFTETCLITISLYDFSWETTNDEH